MNYCAVIGDMVKSRKLNNRQEVQNILNSTLNNINKKFDKDIASNFTITLGDEFQGLLKTPHYFYDIVKEIRRVMSPVSFVFGIGIGRMDTIFNKDLSIGSDGPAYHYARKMVERAKKKKPSICFFSQSPEDELINSMLYFIESCVSSRTNKQIEIVNNYTILESQYKVADTLDLNQATVSKILDKAFYYEVSFAEEKIKEFLKNKYNSGDAL